MTHGELSDHQQLQDLEVLPPSADDPARAAALTRRKGKQPAKPRKRKPETA
jgi:hypothetical protein